MNIFIIYWGEHQTDAENLKDTILKEKSLEEALKNAKKMGTIDKNAGLKVLMLKCKSEEKVMNWKKEAYKLIKDANLILYVLSPEGHKSCNINWELRTALKFDKCIHYIKWDVLKQQLEGTNNMEGAPEKYTLNKVLENGIKRGKDIKELLKLEELYDIIKNDYKREYINLINDGLKKQKDLDVNVILEQYKFFAETSESLVNRRQNVNSFYITANTALIAVIATAFSDNAGWIGLVVSMVLSIPGILLNASWKKILEAYGITNSSKLKILNMLEKQLEVSLYGAEWDDMSYQYNKRRYVCFTDSEMKLPKVFNILYGCIIATCIVALVVMGMFKVLNII